MAINSLAISAIVYEGKKGMQTASVRRTSATFCATLRTTTMLR